jgi:hypothetical protein
MGKNFSMNNQGQRKKSDFYETPFSMTHQILDRIHWNIKDSILEPSCGNSAIVQVLKNYFTNISHYDLYKGEYKRNFLLEDQQYDYIITNPPYSLAHEFILKAKEIARKEFCFLLPLSYLHGQKRFIEIYRDTAFLLKTVYVFTRYPLLGEELREDGKYNTGMQVYAWFLWNKSYKSNPTIEWIDNNDYVLRNYDK